MLISNVIKRRLKFFDHVDIYFAFVERACLFYENSLISHYELLIYVNMSLTCKIANQICIAFVNFGSGQLFLRYDAV